MSATLQVSPATETADRDGVLHMINAAWMCQAIGVACALGIPDRLAAEAATGAELAARLRTSADGVLRLLRGLATLGLVRARDDGTFALTADGALLTTSGEDSLHAWAILSATRGWAAWTHLAEGVRTGRNVRSRAELDGYADFRAGEGTADVFNRAMGILTRPVALALRDKMRFAGDELVVDVGGGAGHLVAPLLAAHPRMRAIVFDLDHARELAEETLAPLGLRERWQFVPGSFFEGVPPGADAYLLKSVLHNWDDGHAIAILQRCRDAMTRRARLVILERVIAPVVGRSAIDRENTRSDLQMLLACDGRERTEAEFRPLLEAAGLALGRITALTPLVSAIEAGAA